MSETEQSTAIERKHTIRDFLSKHIQKNKILVFCDINNNMLVL